MPTSTRRALTPTTPCCSRKAGQRYRRLLDQGWTDALRTLHPEEAIYTFWDYKRNRWPRDAGLRIDHLLLSADLAPRLRDAGVDKPVRGQPGASDHAPAWIILSDAPIRRARAGPRPRKAGRKAS